MTLFSPTHLPACPLITPLVNRHLPYQHGQFGGLSHFRHAHTKTQWEFQDPKMEVLYHRRPYFVGIFPEI